MPQPKTDSDFKPITFTREIDGTTHEQTATSAEQEVRLRWDGWRVKKAAAKSAETKSDTKSAAK